MAKFRRKPVMVDAEQFFPARKSWPEGVHCRRKTDALGADSYFVTSVNGEAWCIPGDWIVTVDKDERYPCNALTFAAGCEAVDDG